MNIDKITPQLLEELHKRNLLWLLASGIQNDWINTYEDEEVSIDIGQKIRELLPQVAMPEDERKRMDKLLDDKIDSYVWDIQQSKY